MRRRLSKVLGEIQEDLNTDDDDRVLRTALYFWASEIKSFRVYYKVARQLLTEKDPEFKPSIVTKQLLQMLVKDNPDVPQKVMVLKRDEMLRVASLLPPISRAALYIQYATGMRATSVVEMRQGDLVWDEKKGKKWLALRFRADKRAPHAYGIWRLIDEPELTQFVVQTVGVSHAIPDALIWKLRPRLFAGEHVLRDLMKTRLVRRARHRAATLIAGTAGMDVESAVMGHSKYTARRYLDAAPLEALLAAQALADD